MTGLDKYAGGDVDRYSWVDFQKGINKWGHNRFLIFK